MNLLLGLGLASLALVVPAAPARRAPVLTISLAHGSPTEIATQAQLLRVLDAYPEASRWAVTNHVLVDDDATPHSHPVLTLHTRHLKDDILLLSTWVHEQLHWFVDTHPMEARTAMQDLQLAWPKVPVGFPEGASTEQSTYEHIMVVALEHAAMRHLLGELVARQVAEFWAHDHYTWIYRLVMDNWARISGIARSSGLWVDTRATPGGAGVTPP